MNSTGPSNEIFVEILLAFMCCYVILIEWTFRYFVMCKYMSATLCVNGIAQFTYFLASGLNITLFTSCNSHFVYLNLNFFSLNLENKLNKRVRNVAEIKYRLAKLPVTFCYFLQDVII